jgi:CDP-diacylglycerol--glycerol-3-phosphate 3-phosphatidyltransferase
MESDAITSDDTMRQLTAWWWAAVGLCVSILLTGFFVFNQGRPRPSALLGFLQSIVVMGYVLGLLRYGLRWNHHPQRKILHSTFGCGTWLTIIRGALIAVLAGYLFQPWPASQFLPGRLSWAPGLLYLSASILDNIDGRVARAGRQETRLGAFLDINLDALGLLIAPLVAIGYGQLPVTYLSVGCAYYVFMAGIRLRKKLSMPVVEPGPWRGARVIAGLQMGFVGIALLPAVKPPLTTLAAYVMMIPLLGGFVRDWVIVCGYWKPGGFLKLIRYRCHNQDFHDFTRHRNSQSSKGGKYEKNS